MSHNKIKIGSATPDQNGDVTLNLTDLSDVSGTPSVDQFLKYNGSGWEPVPGGSISSVEYIFIGRGEASAYSNSPHGTGSFSSSDTIYVYDTAPSNTITGATITKTSDWIESITLPAGNYAVSGQTNLIFSSSGYAAFGFYDSSNNRLSQLGVIGENRSSGAGGGGDLAYSILELTASTTIKLRLYAISGTIDTGSNQGNTPSEAGLIVIEKLG
jgi:hypothetical protein